MTSTTAPAAAPNLMFSHMGLSVRDVPRMEDFYTRVLGFTVTDRGEAGGMQLVFLSRDPRDHHQIVLASGRPDHLPANTANPQFGPSINQISFRVGSLPHLRALLQQLQAENIQGLFPANHGVAWSIYAHDPEGNNLEFFVDTPWYFPQPFLEPLDLSLDDDALARTTLAMCQAQPGFEMVSDWRARIAPRMRQYVPASA